MGLHTRTELSLPTNLVGNHIVGLSEALKCPRIERKPSNSSVDGELGDEEGFVSVTGVLGFKHAVLVDSRGRECHGPFLMNPPTPPSTTFRNPRPPYIRRWKEGLG